MWFGVGIAGLTIWVAIAFWPARVAARKAIASSGSSCSASSSSRPTRAHAAARGRADDPPDRDPRRPRGRRFHPGLRLPARHHRQPRPDQHPGATPQRHHLPLSAATSQAPTPTPGTIRLVRSPSPYPPESSLSQGTLVNTRPGEAPSRATVGSGNAPTPGSGRARGSGRRPTGHRVVDRRVRRCDLRVVVARAARDVAHVATRRLMSHLHAWSSTAAGAW